MNKSKEGTEDMVQKLFKMKEWEVVLLGLVQKVKKGTKVPQGHQVPLAHLQCRPLCQDLLGQRGHQDNQDHPGKMAKLVLQVKMACRVKGDPRAFQDCQEIMALREKRVTLELGSLDLLGPLAHLGPHDTRMCLMLICQALGTLTVTQN